MRRATVEVLVAGHLEGTGWAADAEGWIVTAAHAVVGWRSGIEVVSQTGERFPAEVAAVDLGSDLALLRVVGSEGSWPVLPLAARVPSAGEELSLFGTALFRHELRLAGRVARSEATFEPLAATKEYARVFVVDAAVPPGLSGGAWVDRFGQVVGCQSGVVTEQGRPVGLALAAPVDAIDRLLAERTDRIVPTMGCGLEELPSQSSGFLARLPTGVEGLVCVPVHPDSPAQAAGLTEESVVVAVEGLAVRRREDLLSVVRDHHPGDVVSLTVLSPREPDPRRVDVRLGVLGD
ncbi:MAG: S1C family serine protease [Planctomycetota bacterium]|nr:S1C family serine protease [Planctomycetota bacterium]MDP6761836.1 S1C family serine protease [Planctomycetota bacterium]MDP6988882.1 S1C family serine protease [Planctomycetota bacterium]